MKAFYLDATAVAVTSVWPEPFGMVGPEAMRYGLPVVAFDSGAVREWLTNGENGFLVPWMDITRFANSLEALLQNKALAGQLGRNGLERVDREYGVARQVDALEQLFWQVRASKPLRNPGGDRGRHGLNTGSELNVKLEQSEDAEDAAAQEGSEHREVSGRMEERVNV
jgi:hypothetical protein